MKLSTIFLFTLLLSLQVKAVDVYIIAGQSNGWRLSQLTRGNKKTLGGKIHYFGMHCVSEPVAGKYQLLDNINGMGAGLASTLSKLSENDIVFIQYCRCGAAINHKAVNGWYPGNDPKNGKIYNDGLYGRFLKYIAHAKNHVENKLKLKWEVKALFWHQGEGDVNRNTDNKHRKRLSNLFYRFRQDLGKSLPIIAGELRERPGVPTDKAINDAIRACAAKDPRLIIVNSQDLSFEKDYKGQPNVHYNGTGCFKLGQRMAAAYKRLISL